MNSFAPARALRLNNQSPSTPERRKYEDVFARALAYAQRLVPLEEATELAHDVSVELARDPDGPLPSGPVVYLAVTRRLRDAIRDARRRANREQMYLESRDASATLTRAPELDLEANELRDRIRATVAAMPEGMREVFILVREQELSYKDVAARLGVSVGTVHTQLSRAAARLRDCVRRYEADEPPSTGASR